MKGLKVVVVILGLIFLIFGCEEGRADIYAPTDSLWLPVGTLDTLFLDIADADSVWFKWFDPAGALIDSSKITSATRTGFFLKKIKASDASNNSGTYSAIAVVYKDGHSGIKTWSWVVKADPLEVQRDAKHLYVVPEADALADGSALSWATACSLNTVLARCSGADEYFVHIGSGLYKNGEVLLESPKTGHYHFLGQGIENTIIFGIKEGAVPTHYIFKANMTESTSVEVAHLTMRGYEATSGVEDSATFAAFGCFVSRGSYVHDCRIYNFKEGIHTCAGCKYNKFERNVISKPITAGIYVEQGEDNLFLDNFVDSLRSARVGIHILAQSYRNIIKGNVVNAYSGKAIYSQLGSGNLIVNNYLKAYNVDSLIVDATGGANVFIDNHQESFVNDIYTAERDWDALRDSIHSAHGETENLDGWNPATDEVLADAVKISGDGTAADNAEAMLDGTGGVALTLNQLRINATSGYGAIDIDNSGGPAIDARSGSNCDAIYLLANGTGDGIYSKGGSDGCGAFFEGQGTGPGIDVWGGATATYGLHIDGTKSGVGIEGAGTPGYYDISLDGDGKIHGGMTGNISGDSAMQIIHTGTAQAGAATSITLDAGASAIDNFYSEPPYIIHIIEGTGEDQARLIMGYNGTSKVATVYPAWKTNPDNTSIFRIYPTAESEGGVIKIHR